VLHWLFEARGPTVKCTTLDAVGAPVERLRWDPTPTWDVVRHGMGMGDPRSFRDGGPSLIKDSPPSSIGWASESNKGRAEKKTACSPGAEQQVL